MSALALAEVLKTIHGLPALPAVVLDVLASMDQVDVDVDTLAGKIALDQTLAAKTLRVANSSFYGMQRQVTTIDEAIAILGFQTVRHLATTAALMGALAGRGNGALGLMAFWRHAIGAAVCARSLAQQLGANQEQAYLAGLLHDIGRLVLATQFAAHYAAVLAERTARDCVLIEAERAVLGLDHAQVGEALARHWKFPDPILQCVAGHHAAELPDGPALTLLVHVADAISHALDFSNDEDDLVPCVAQATWQRLALDDQQLVAVFQQAERQFEAASAVLGP